MKPRREVGSVIRVRDTGTKKKRNERRAETHDANTVPYAAGAGDGVYHDAPFWKKGSRG